MRVLLLTISFITVIINNYSSEVVAKERFVSNGDIIYYPGSFDPFHETHFREAYGALENFPNASMVILPVETAYYQDVHYPRALSYDDSLKLIQESFKGIDRVSVSKELRDIQRYALDLLSEKFCRSNSKLLVGSDVLELWSSLPRFESFFRKCQFIVSEDPKTIKLNEDLKARFQHERNVIFIKTDVSGIRSRSVKGEMSEGDLSSLPKTARDWLVQNNSEITDGFKKRLDLLLLDQFNKIVRPLLFEKGIDHATIDYMLSTKELRLKAYGLFNGDEKLVDDLASDVILNRKEIAKSRELLYQSLRLVRRDLEGKLDYFIDYNMKLLMKINQEEQDRSCASLMRK